MSKIEKALQRVSSKPKDYSWDELVSLVRSLGLEMKNVSGSGRRVENPKTAGTYFLHQPHPSRILKGYQVRGFKAFLMKEGLLHDANDELQGL